MLLSYIDCLYYRWLSNFYKTMHVLIKKVVHFRLNNIHIYNNTYVQARLKLILNIQSNGLYLIQIQCNILSSRQIILIPWTADNLLMLSTVLKWNKIDNEMNKWGISLWWNNESSYAFIILLTSYPLKQFSTVIAQCRFYNVMHYRWC